MIFTATGSRMHAIAKAPSSHLLILEIDGSGTQGLIFQQPIERQLMPTSELSTHLAVHALLLAERPAQQALIHAHVTPLITLSHYPTIEDEESLNDILLRVHPETLYFLPAGAGLVPFSLPGSADLGFKTAQRFIRHDVVLWERHGALACGADLEQAFDRLEIAAKAASIFLDCKKAGFSLKTFDENEMNILRAHYAAMSKDQSN